MQKLRQEDIARVKALGFLRNRGTDCFSGRIVPEGTVFTAQQLAAVARLAEQYGSGKVIFTARLTAEVPGIAYDKIDEVIAEGAKSGLSFGGTGAKIRPVVACKGTTCVYGNCDTQALAKTIHRDYYLGWGGVKLPHKFKIAIGGCPNSCMKPSLNDFGIEAHRAPDYASDACRGCRVCQVAQKCPCGAAALRDGKLVIDPAACTSCGVCVGKCPFGAVKADSPVQFKIFIGGTWGKKTRMGTPLPALVAEQEVLPLLEKTILWFRRNAYEKERLGAAVDRLGVGKLLADLAGETLLGQKDEILAAPIQTRPQA